MNIYSMKKRINAAQSSRDAIVELASDDLYYLIHGRVAESGDIAPPLDPVEKE